MERNLIFLEQYTTEFKGEKYEVYKFIDEITLRIFYGSNLTVKNLDAGKKYSCEIEVRSFNGQDKIKVKSVKE